MDVHEVAAEIRQVLAEARALPMSASVVVNRDQLVSLLDRLQDGLAAAGTPATGAGAEPTDDPTAERDRLLSETGVLRQARQRAEELLEEARAEAADLRRETDDYVDTKLANLQVALTKTLDAVNRGRDRLHQRSELGRLPGPEVDLPQPAEE